MPRRSEAGGNSMLTRCPACTTSFRVTPDQLKARGGKVRCGKCQTVFNALDSLVDTPPPAAAPATAPQSHPAAPPLAGTASPPITETALAVEPSALPPDSAAATAVADSPKPPPAATDE